MNQFGSNNEQLPKEFQDALSGILDRCEAEDSYVRRQQIRLWKKYERFWHGVQYLWWSETQQDWLSPIDTRWDNSTDENREGASGPFYDFVTNIYRGHGESVIAALSAQVPTVRFPPDDADNEDDVYTSKTYSKVADLIQRHNQSKLLLLSSLLIAWNQGLICAYHAPKQDKAFGNLKLPKYDSRSVCNGCGYISESTDDTSCPVCEPLYNPDDPSAPPIAAPMEQKDVLVGYEDTPKSRVLIELFSPLFVKVGYFAHTQKDTGYIILTLDQPLTFLQSLFPHIRDEMQSSVASADTYERVARSPSSFAYAINDQTYLGELRRAWIRPWQFESVDDEKIRAQLKELFPDGAYVCFVGKTYAESRNESLDDYWTLGKTTLSTYIHCDALGQPLIPLQEMKNTVKNLSIETIEQGISSVFADTEVLDFEDWSRHEIRPGMMVPVKARPGQRISDSFYEGPKATLSKDVGVFEEKTEQDAQFVVGSFPSIYGGPTEASSRTAAEYNMSRQMALQRLSISWNLICHWWARLMEKCVKLYVQNLVADERYVVREKENYVNVWIRESEARGKVGEVEPEGAETFPMSMSQKQDLLFKLLQLNNEMLNATMFDPENRKILADALAFPELHVPDEDQRIKQVREIQTMIGDGNVPGMPVPIEPLVDNPEIHVVVIKNWAVSEKGLDCKQRNPEGYNYVMQHLQEHMMSLQPQGEENVQNVHPPVNQ